MAFYFCTSYRDNFKNPGKACGGELSPGCGWSLHGFHRDETTRPATVDEVYPAGDLRVESVVVSPANIQAGLQFGATLADDDGTTRNYLASKDLHAKPLSVGVASVFGAS
jgi:hypothetical protein